MSRESMNSFSPRLISLLIATLLTPCALAQEQVAGTSAEALGLSSYRHFVVYPHLEKAIRAQQSGDEQTALREFRYLHQQLPDNVPLTLWLTESLRHFGHDEQARQLLTEQLKRQPQDARLQQQLAAIPRNVKPVTTVEQLLAEQKACDATPSTRCRSETGQNALLLNQLTVAQAQLSDAAFARTKEGKALNDGLIQRAIYLKAWPLADEGFSRKSQQQKLTVAEQNQWFDVLLAGKLDDRIQTLETTPAQQLAYASTLASRGENALLQRYLATHQPRFTDQAQEQNWLYLLSRYGDPAQSRAETLRVAQQMYQRAPQNLAQRSVAGSKPAAAQPLSFRRLTADD
jgi:bacteriophage N4 adsorption protein A